MNIPKAFKIDDFWRVIIPKVPKVLTHSQMSKSLGDRRNLRKSFPVAGFVWVAGIFEPEASGTNCVCQNGGQNRLQVPFGDVATLKILWDVHQGIGVVTAKKV